MYDLPYGNGGGMSIAFDAKCDMICQNCRHNLLSVFRLHLLVLILACFGGYHKRMPSEGE